MFDHLSLYSSSFLIVVLRVYGRRELTHAVVFFVKTRKKRVVEVAEHDDDTATQNAL